MKLIDNNLYPDEGNWLYQDEGEVRYFYSSVTLAKPENIKDFKECTNAEKEEWERENEEFIEEENKIKEEYGIE